MHESVCDLFIGVYVCVRMMSLCVVSLRVGVRAYKRVHMYIYVHMYANLCVCKGSQAGQGTMLPFL